MSDNYDAAAEWAEREIKRRQETTSARERD